MFNIPKDDVWVFWPTTICNTFPEDAGNIYLNGKQHFKLELDFELTDETDLSGELACAGGACEINTL